MAASANEKQRILDVDDALAYFCGAIVGAWIADHAVRLLFESWKGQAVRIVNGMPLLPFHWEDKLRLASPLPSNWWGVVFTALGLGALWLFLKAQRLSERRFWIWLPCAFVASWCVYGYFHRLFPPPFSREQLRYFGYVGYFASAANSMLGWALVWALVIGCASLFLTFAKRLKS